MNINLIADDSVSSAPAGFVAAVQAAASIFDQTFVDPITINIRYGWGTFNNQVDPTLTNFGGADGGPVDTDKVSYATLTSWLAADENSAYDVSAYNSLPPNSPQLPSSFVVASAQEKAFGQFTGPPSVIDGAIGFGTDSSSSFWEEGALHEIGHALGRDTAYYEGGPTLMDLFRYDAPGHFQWGAGRPAYFSIDGGQTDLANFSTIDDYGDFAVDNLTPADPFDYHASNPPINSLTSLDIEVMDVLGFNTSFAIPTVTATNQTVGVGQSVPLTSIFTVTSTKPVTQYQVFFGYPEGGSPAVGSVTQGGTLIAQDQAVTVPTLGSLAFIGAAMQGTDKIWLKAYNGNWSPWTEADITDQGPPAPAVTANNQMVAYNQSVSISNIFSVTGNAVSAYQIYFGYPEGGAPALGTVTLNGTPIAQDQAVPLSSLANLSYVGAAVQGTDKIWLKAYDGTWSGWTEADITDPGVPPPVVTPENQTVANGQPVALTSIFSVSGGATQYQIWFGYPEGGAPALGTLTNNGTPIAQDQAVTLSSLANLLYTGSPTTGVDKIWLKAFNGIWTGWIEADITDPGVPPPSITPINQSAAYGQSISLGNIFSVGAATRYQIWFSYPEGGAPALGSVTLNGSPIGLDQPVTVSSLSNLSYIGGASHGTDKIWLMAYNGNWSSFVEADITDTGITPINQSVWSGQSVPLTSIFAGTSGATSFQIWFSYPEGGAPAIGSLTQNGIPIAQDQAVTLSSLSNVSYVDGSGQGTDKIWLKAYDGTWSNWIEADITDNPAPTIVPTNQTVGYNQTVGLSNIFAASGGTISSYQIWFSFPEGGASAIGSVSQNGSPIAEDQAVTVSSLNNISYTGGSGHGTDKIWLKAYNGTWTGWTEADITDSGVGGQVASASAFAPPDSSTGTAAQASVGDISLLQNYMASAFPAGGATTLMAPSAAPASSAPPELAAHHS